MKINPKDLQQIIKEEALRLKTRMMLEAEKASILKKLQEMEECEMMEDASMATADGASQSPEDVEIKPEVAATIEKNANAIVNRLSPEQLAKIKGELQASGLAGQSVDAIEDKVEKMLPMNEAIMAEGWDKSKLYNWLIGGGLTATLAGLVTTVLGSLSTQDLSNLADYTGATVTPSNAVIAGIVALALGAVGTAIGVKGKADLSAAANKMSPEQAAKIIAARKLRGHRE
jgi:hypothetical protein